MKTLQVEVFKTNIEQGIQAEYLKAQLAIRYPQLQVNFDLDDRDRILRIAAHDTLPVHEVMELTLSLGHKIMVLPD